MSDTTPAVDLKYLLLSTPSLLCWGSSQNPWTHSSCQFDSHFVPCHDATTPTIQSQNIRSLPCPWRKLARKAICSYILKVQHYSSSWSQISAAIYSFSVVLVFLSTPLNTQTVSLIHNSFPVMWTASTLATHVAASSNAEVIANSRSLHIQRNS